MKTLFRLSAVIVLASLVAACATPKTTLTNSATGETVECGGSRGGALMFGAIGYVMQRAADKSCVAENTKKGFDKKVVTLDD